MKGSKTRFDLSAVDAILKKAWIPEIVEMLNRPTLLMETLGAQATYNRLQSQRLDELYGVPDIDGVEFGPRPMEGERL